MIFFVMAQWLRLGVLARRRSHRKMFTVVTFMSPPAFYITIQTCLHLYRQKLLKFGWFDVMWQETPRVEIRPGRKSWDRAEMAQTGQNYHYFPKRAENQNDQNLMVVWWYRFTINSPCRTHFRFFCPLLRVTFAKIFRQVFTDDSLTYSSFTQISRPVLFWEPETNTLRGFGCAMKTVLAITIMLHSVLLYKYVKINAK